MFIDIWDKDNKAIKLNNFNIFSFEEQIVPFDEKEYSKYVAIEFKNTGKDGFYQKLKFTNLVDCITFFTSDTFQHVFESKCINVIKIWGFNCVTYRYFFKYDNR